LEGDGTKKSPDFLLRDSASKAYLEARLATCMPDRLRSALSRKGDVLDALFEVGSRDFIVHAAAGIFDKLPKLKELKGKLQKWLDGLDWEQLWPLSEQGQLEELPTYDARSAGVPCTFVAIPKPLEQRGQANVGGVTSEVCEIEVNPAKSILQALKEKSGRYGQLEHPYVIAVNVLRAPWDEYLVADALLGPEAVGLRSTPDGEEEERFRVGGFWLGLDGQPRNTQVSAVVLVFGLDPTTIAADGTKMVLYHNHWAERPYSGALCRLPQAKLRHGQLIPGAAPRDILGLKETWLEGRL
jgi:hypothetical protein